MTPTTLDRPAMSGGASASVPDTQNGATAPTILSRSELFAKRPPFTTQVVVKGWGTVKVASLSQGQWEELNARHQDAEGKTDTGHGYMVEAVAAALVNPDDSYMFADPVEGAKDVRNLPLAVCGQLFAAVASQSGLTPEAREALGKGSEPTPAAGG